MNGRVTVREREMEAMCPFFISDIEKDLFINLFFLQLKAKAWEVTLLSNV